MPVRGGGARTAAPVEPAVSMGLAPERAGSDLYRDRRLLALYFDLNSMPPADQFRAQAAAVEFLRNRMTASDLVAVISFSGVVRVRQDFTGNRDLLLAAVNQLFLNQGWQWGGQSPAGRSGEESAAEYGSAFGEDDGEFYLFTTDRQLAALQSAVQILGKVNQKKALVYFASGLRLTGLGNQAQLAATINAAIRANVALYTVDARGLVATPPLGDASQPTRGGVALYNGASAMAVASDLQRSQDTLFALATDTGGKALVDHNDLTVGIVNAQRSITNYYLVGYHTTNSALDGRYRRIRIQYNGEKAAKLSYREGYYAGKQFRQFTVADKERQLHDALGLGDPITDIPIAAELDYFQLNSAEYFVSVAIRIPGRELALARRRGAERTSIDFLGEVKDEYQVTLANVRDQVDMQLGGETAAQLSKRQIQYDTGFTLLPGTYSIKLLARDNETGRIGTYLASFVVPNLNKEEKRIPISSVILSNQRVELKQALFSAGKAKELAANPLVRQGVKLVPSVTRLFRRSGELLVYLEAYRSSVAATKPLLAFVTFYRGAGKALEMGPFALTEAKADRLTTAPLFFELPLGGLDPGGYMCQVSVLDPADQKSVFWQGPIRVAP